MPSTALRTVRDGERDAAGARRGRGRAAAASRARRDRASHRRDDGGLAHAWDRLRRIRRSVARRGHAFGARAQAARPTSHTAALPRQRTMSLPQRLGGDANWDYWFCWVRDAAYTLDALLALGRGEDAHASFSWCPMLIATTAPDIRPLYGLSGRLDLSERGVDLDGDRGSRPVRTGNAAVEQTQLGVYGDLLDTGVALRSRGRNALDSVMQGRLDVPVPDRLALTWRDPDCGFWEIWRRNSRNHTDSKLSGADRVRPCVRLAQKGELPNDDAPKVEVRADEDRELRRRTAAGRMRSGAYRFCADEDKLDTATSARLPEAHLRSARAERLASTIEQPCAATRRRRALLYRHSDAVGQEGASWLRRSGSRTRSPARRSTRPPK